MMPPTDVVLVIGDGSEDTLPERVSTSLRESGLGLHHATGETGVETLQAWMAQDAPPPAVLLTEDLERPLAVARRVHRAAPLVQIVFLAGGERRARLHREMASAPMIGNHWTVADPDLESLQLVLSNAVRATRQRSNLRTTLDRINLKLQEPYPPADSMTYRKLIVSDRYLASILEYAQDAIVSVDGHGLISSWNRGAATLFGLQENEALERGVDLLATDERTNELLTLVQKARVGQVIDRHQIELLRADGTTFDAEITLAPVRDEAGRVESVSAIARDVTERKRYEASLREANLSLKNALELLEARRLELMDLNAKLEVRATTDALTGLKNRVVFHNSLLEMIRVAGRSGMPLSLLIVDVDHFKRINDSMGHLEGDRILRAVADCLVANTRQQDVVARFGGEEFAVLLPNTPSRDAADVAEGLRSACEGLTGSEPALTVSIGVASFREDDGDVSLIDRADKALYEAKRTGRNRVALAGA